MLFCYFFKWFRSTCFPSRDDRTVFNLCTTITQNVSRFRLDNMEMSRLARDGTTEPVSRDQIFRRERTRTGKHSLVPEQDW